MSSVLVAVLEDDLKTSCNEWLGLGSWLQSFSQTAILERANFHALSIPKLTEGFPSLNVSKPSYLRAPSFDMKE